MTATGYKVRGLQRVALTWSGAATSSVDLYRDGVLILTTANDGAETDALNKKGTAAYTYVLCEVGTSVCSSPISVRFETSPAGALALAARRPRICTADYGIEITSGAHPSNRSSQIDISSFI